jgi:hypothetical protein
MFTRTGIAAVLIAAVCCLSSAQTNVLTYHNDNFHTGQNLTETILMPVNVNASTFGNLFVLPADGKVEAQPLYVAGLNMLDQGTHNVAFVATEHGTVYAYDADQGGDPFWQVSLLGPGETPADTQGCGQVTPEIGVTATPVIDLTAGGHGTIYLVAMSRDSIGTYHQRLHALDIVTGEEEFSGPVEIAATFPGDGDGSTGGLLQFDPKMYKERAALILSNGVIYTSWASHCDFEPYTGWVIGYDQYSLSQTLAHNFTPNGEGGSIWGAGAGPAVDSGGYLFFQLANGTFDPGLDVLGFPNSGDYGNAFVKLSVNGGSPSVLDYWTMHNTVPESDADADLGSGGVMLLPDLTDALGTIRHLGLGAGKDSNIYVFDRDNMGKFNPDSDGAIYQELQGTLGNSVFAAPAWFNGTVYFGAIGDRIRAFPVTAARVSAAPSAITPTPFGYPGATPAISANGSGNAILWALENNEPVVLHAYDANDIGIELYNSNQVASDSRCDGGGIKWIPPTIAEGKVVVPTTTDVCVFGLFSGSK